MALVCSLEVKRVSRGAGHRLVPLLQVEPKIKSLPSKAHLEASLYIYPFVFALQLPIFTHDAMSAS